MTDRDLEGRVARALADGAEAPGAGGLVAGARRRARERRRRRAVIGAAAAVVAIVVAVGAVGATVDRGERSTTAGPPTSAPTVTDRVSDTASTAPAGGDEWVSVVVNGVSVDLPPGWVRARCPGGLAVFVPPRNDSCQDIGPAVAIQDEGPLDYNAPVLADGSGALVVDTQLVTVDGLAFDDVRRVLASARPVSEPAVAVSTWTRVQVVADPYVTYATPEDDRVDVQVADAIPRCAAPRKPSRPVGDHWEVYLCRNRIVTVVAPTQALAEVVALQVTGW